MTLLVLDLHIPTAGQVHGERELLRALGALDPQWVAYGMSFLTLGIFWAGPADAAEPHPRRIARPDLDSSGLSIHDHVVAAVHAPAGGIHHLPQRPAPLLAQHSGPGGDALLELEVCHARRLLKDDTPYEVSESICKRVVVAQSLYAVGAAFCVINTWVSIAAI